jgi:hypothetical protein
MENIDCINKKDRILICGMASIFLIVQSFSVIYAEELQLPDDFKIDEYFVLYGSVGGSGLDWQALQDPNNNPILVACIKGLADDSLKPLGILDVGRRLEVLERGNLIKKVDRRYRLTVPAIVGDKRERLREYTEQTAQQLLPSTEKMISRIQPHLAGRDEMLYHVLWSIVMDGGQAWDAARKEMNKKIDAGDTSIQDKVWLLYPQHPFRAGTNSWTESFGNLQVTGSSNTPNPNVVDRVISQYATHLIQAIEQDHAVESAEAKDALGKYGLIDEAGKVRIYEIKPDSEAAQSYAELGAQFGRQMMGQLDVKKVAEMLDVSPGMAFLIAYHEICWQLLQDLAEKKVLSVPQIVTHAGVKTSDTYQLVSLMIMKSIKDPLPDMEMSAEEARAIDEFRRIKARILTGDGYNDTSTPLRAVLTRFSSWQPQERDSFMNLDILRAPLPPEEPEEISLWPVYAGDKELQDTFILAYSKGQWIWIGNMGANYDWNLARSAFEKLAREKIGQSIPAGDSDNSTDAETENPGESVGNRVLSLDGRGAYMLVADSQSLRSFSDAITLEVLLKASSFYADDWAISSIIRKNVASGAENFLLRFRNIDGSLCFQMGLGDLGTLPAPYEFAANKWYHLAGTYDGNTVTAFVNGQAVASQNISGRLYIDNSDLYIGKGDPEYLHGECFHGELDEVRIWNVARSQEQIQAATSTSLSGREKGLLAYWNFDDGTAKDLSGHDNEGLLHGGARIVESLRPVSLTPRGKESGELLAWWKFDEVDGNDVTDSSGNDYKGTLIGNPQWRPAGGKVGGALEFDGGGDYVKIGNEPAFDISGPITIAAWIKVNVFDKRWQALITKGDTSWRLQRTAEEDTLTFHCTGITSVTGQWPEGIEGKKNVNDGQWHHVVGVYDGAQVSLYVDGVTDNSSQASGSIRANDLAVTIGGNSEQAGREWNGLIDEVCIIAGAIDANAVNTLYTDSDPVTIAQTANPQLQGPDKLLAWWKFENDANDSAGSNHGTTQGNPTYAAGKFGRAISFDGDDYVDCGNPDSLNFGTDDWTISAWIKTTQTGTDEDDEHKNRGTIFANGGDEAGGIRYALAINEAYLGTVVLTTDNDTAKVQAIGKTVVNDGNWHHIVGMRNAGQLRVYVDSVLDGGSYLPAGYDLSGTSQHNAYIGVITDHRDGSLYKYFVGLIDEVCVIRGSIDADGIRSLYSGEEPVTVAKTAVIARPAQAAVAEPQSRLRQKTPATHPGSVEGDWRLTSDQSSQEFVIEICKQDNGTLSATLIAEGGDGTSQTMPLSGVAFDNGKFHFEMPSNQGVFEGTMKEDGLTIEGEYRQPEQVTAVVLKRIDIDRSRTKPTSPAQLQASTEGKSNIAIALILVLVLAGVVGGIVFFLVKSSIRT